MQKYFLFSFNGSTSIELSENNFESLFEDADNEKAVDIFSLHSEGPFLHMKKDSSRGITTVRNREGYLDEE